MLLIPQYGFEKRYGSAHNPNDATNSQFKARIRATTAMSYSFTLFPGREKPALVTSIVFYDPREVMGTTAFNRDHGVWRWKTSARSM